MGVGQSSFNEKEEDQDQLQHSTEVSILPSDGAAGKKKNGYRVLAIQENSPACKEGLVPFFDFIVEANGVRLVQEDGTFVRIIKSFEGKPLTITLYNCKCHQERKVSFVPRRGWGGDGLLGLTIKFDSYEDSDEQVFHVLEVAQNSPSSEAGFESNTDYILGTPYSTFTDLDDLYDLIAEVAAENELSGDRGIDMFVYSTKTDIVRRLVVVPRPGWGGKGVLGCGIGYGYLHRLPMKSQSTSGYARSEDFIVVRKRRKSDSSSSNSLITRRNSSSSDVIQQKQNEQEEQDKPASKPPLQEEEQAEEESLKLVTTPHGPGQLVGRKLNGTCVVHLDWGNDCELATIVAFLEPGNITSTLALPESSGDDSAAESKVIDVDLPHT